MALEMLVGQTSRADVFRATPGGAIAGQIPTSATCVWVSSDEQVATVATGTYGALDSSVTASGTITAVAAGTATITATYGSAQASIEVVVSNNVVTDIVMVVGKPA